jgi:hypothetical protein
MTGRAAAALQAEHLARLLESRGSRLATKAPTAKITAADRSRYDADLAGRLADRFKTPKQRATDLLLSLLNPEQTATFAEGGEFTTTGSNGKRYLIRLGREHNVFEVDADGTRLVNICGHVRDNIPNEDNMAAQKMALESDADAFLAIANSRTLPSGRA